MKSIFLLLFAFSFCYCTKLSHDEPQSEDIRLLGRYKVADAKNESVELPKELKEISGMTSAGNGYVYAHNDEEGVVYKVDYKSGEIVKSISLGKNKLKEDFEGIASANGQIYLIASNGEIYSSNIDDEDNSEVNYEKIKTHLSGKNDVEGLCYYPSNNSLLVSCKGDPGKDLDDKKAIYSFGLGSNELSEDPIITIDLKKLKDKYDVHRFSPSGITYNEESNTIFIISANSQGILEISTDGEIINYSVLPSKFHRQPESITINNGFLLIGDEGGRKGKITIYKVE